MLAVNEQAVQALVHDVLCFMAIVVLAIFLAVMYWLIDR